MGDINVTGNAGNVSPPPLISTHDQEVLASTIALTTQSLKRDGIERIQQADDQAKTVASQLRDLTADRPGLAYPGAHSSTLSQTKAALGNPWLSPDGMVALLSAMIEFMSQQKLNELQEGLNGAKTMLNNVKMGKEAAALELAKGWKEFGAELAQGFAAAGSALSMGISLGARLRTLSSQKSTTPESVKAANDQAEPNTNWQKVKNFVSPETSTSLNKNDPEYQNLNKEYTQVTKELDALKGGPAGADLATAPDKARIETLEAKQTTLAKEMDRRQGVLVDQKLQTYAQMGQIGQKLFESMGHFVNAWMKMEVSQVDSAKAVLHAAQDVNKQLMSKHGEWQSAYQQSISDLVRAIEALKQSQSQQSKLAA